MDHLIPIVNKLQDVFAVVGAPEIELPQLVVVGSQSAGKSSVLENLVGRDFLPRGADIVTRRPLVLQLVTTTGDEAKEGKEWGEFRHLKDKEFKNFEEIREEIERETNRLTGTNKGISSTPIRLTIHSPRVATLTLVDLPGITKVPVGDQPSDIEMQVRSMILEFISNPNAIIVAVSPANSDIANSEALKIAREVDPQGNRTIGVITKLDLMDKGTDALQLLQGKVINLQLGFIGVVNRSQLDINQHKSIEAALKAEHHYFDNHSAYGSVRALCGTAVLADRLNGLLMRHIQSRLPDIRSKLCHQIFNTKAELESYGTVMAGKGLGPLLLHILSKFSNVFCDALEGKSPDVSTAQLYGGARINYVFHDMYAAAIDSIDSFDGLSNKDIRTAVRNAQGPRPSLFIPEIAFELLVKMQIEKLLTPSIQCAERVFEELRRVALQAEKVSELGRFPALRERAMQCVLELLKRRVEPTIEMITNLIKVELAYINTNHPDFLGGSNAVASIIMDNADGERGANKRGSLPKRMQGSIGSKSEVKESGESKSKPVVFHPTPPPTPQPGLGLYAKGVAAHADFAAEPPSEREMIETEIIKNLMESYFSIVKKTVQDSIPKVIMYFLVNHCKANIQSELVSTLYKEELLEELLAEGEDIAEKRKQCIERLAIMDKALEIIHQVSAYTP